MTNNQFKIYAYKPLYLIMMLTGPIAIAHGLIQGDYLWLLGSLLMTPFIGGGLGIDIAMHRYLTHRSFTTTKTKHYILSILAFLSGQGSSIHYAGVHRHHHKHSDTDRDIHSPFYQSFLENLSLIWMTYDLLPRIDRTVKVGLRDLLNDPLNRWLDRWYYHIWAAIIVIGLVLSWKTLVYLILVPAWKGYLEIFMTTYIMHIKIPGSYRNFNTADNSQNHRWYTYFCLGQGMHNNHHQHPSAYQLAMQPKDIDIAGAVIERYWLESDSTKIYRF